MDNRPPASLRSQVRALSRPQRHTLLACLLGWTLDAFDFFILVFAVKAIAHDFASGVASVTVAITCTLAMRPVGRSSSDGPPTASAAALP